MMAAGDVVAVAVVVGDGGANDVLVAAAVLSVKKKGLERSQKSPPRFREYFSYAPAH